MSMDIDFNEWKARKPMGISGCFRVRNEAQFMEQAIRSHLPFLDEAVLCVQPSDDDTLAIARRLAAEDERVKVFEYELVPDWIDTPGFYENDPDKPGHLVHMSNWALSKCSYSWICKVEGDVIALSTVQNIVERVFERPMDTHYYGRVILNVAGEKCDQISLDNPRNGGWDEAFFNNDPDRFRFVRSGRWESVPMGSAATCMGWSALHMKRCKAGKIGWNGERYGAYTRQGVRDGLEAFNRRNPYPGRDDPLGAECLFEATLVTEAQ